MNPEEKLTLQLLNIDLVRDLDIRNVVPFLYQRHILTQDTVKDLLEQEGSFSRNNCQKFLLLILDVCPFREFLNALRYEHAYEFLAQKLEETLKFQRESVEENKRDNRDEQNGGQQREEIMCQPMAKVSMTTRHRRRLVALSQTLQTLSHNGDMQEFRRISDAVTRKFQHCQLKTKGRIKDNMCLADLGFVVLDAEAAAKRVKMEVDAGVGGRDIFHDMTRLIPYTTNPVASSMTYLAR